jgi:hypothetical protein
MISDEKENLLFCFFSFLYEVGPSTAEETLCLCVCHDNSGTIREEKLFFFFFLLLFFSGFGVGWQPRDSILSRTLGSVRKEKNRSSGLDKLRVAILTRAAPKFVVPQKQMSLSLLSLLLLLFVCLFGDLLQLRSLELSGHEILHLICRLACSSDKDKSWRCDQAAVATDCLLIEAFSLWEH